MVMIVVVAIEELRCDHMPLVRLLISSLNLIGWDTSAVTIRWRACSLDGDAEPFRTDDSELVAVGILCLGGGVK